MKVNNRDEARAHQAKLERKQQNVIQKKQNEIKGLARLYDKKIAQIKQDGRTSVTEEQFRQKQLLADEAAKQEVKLKAHRDSIKNLKSSLNNDRDNFIKNHHEQMKAVNKIFKQNISEDFERRKVYAQDLSEEMRSHTQDIELKTRRKKDTVDRDANRAMSNHLKMRDKALHNAEKDFERLRKHVNNQNANALKQDQKEYRKNMKLFLEQKAREQDTHRNNYEKLVKQNKEHFQELTKQEQNSFNQRFTLMQKHYQQLTDTLQTKLDGQIQNMLQKNTTTRKSIETKADDSFYQIEKLDPQILDTGKEYILTIEVPEHEKDSIQLSARRRKLIISQARRYSNSVADKNGSLNKMKRSEVTSKELATKDILNPDKIEQKYVDGVLTFKIAKL